MSVNPRVRDVFRQEWGKRQPRRAKVATEFTAAVQAIVFDRSGGACELDGCGPAQVHHHRAPRGRGGSSLTWIGKAANALAISHACHDRIESHRSEAYASGWLVSRLEGKPADVVPVLYRGRWVQLDDDGGVRPIEGVVA